MLTVTGRYTLVITGAGSSSEPYEFFVDHAPGISLESGVVEEDSPAGTIVGTFFTSDPEDTTPYYFRIQDDAEGRFRIINNQLVVAKGAVLDLDTAPSHVVLVGIDLPSGMTFSQEFTITVTAATVSSNPEPGVPGVFVTEYGRLTAVFEGGRPDTYTVRLNTPPTAHVMLTLNPDLQVSLVDDLTGLGGPPVLTFTPHNWNMPQTIAAYPVSDELVEGNHTGIITHTAYSPDPDYHGALAGTYTVNITDTAAVLTVVGPAVTVVPSDPDSGIESPATLNFVNVEVAGETTLTSLTTISETPPVGFQFNVGTNYYELRTQASFESVEVCLVGAFSIDSRLLHFDATVDAWVDITILETDPLSQDSGGARGWNSGEISGFVTHFSPFFIGVPVNTAPVITSLTSSAEVVPAAVGTPVTLQAAFTDSDLGDVHNAVIDWGDGQQTVLAANNPAINDLNGTLATSHAYNNGGVFSITVTLNDKAGETSTLSTTALVSGVGLQDGVLTAIGTGGRDIFYFRRQGQTIRVDFRLDVHWQDRKDNRDVSDSDADEGDNANANNPRHQHLVFSAADVTMIVMRGGAGNDLLRVGQNIDVTANLDGEEGDDRLWGGAGVNILTDMSGNNRIHACRGENQITVGHGANGIWATSGTPSVVAGDGNNTIDLGSGQSTVTVGDGDNSIHTGRGSDFVATGNGNNTISTGAGNDTIYTGNGDNFVEAGAGDDFVSTGAGRDIIHGQGGNDILLGGGGADSLISGDGRDLLIGGVGKDTLSGDAADDILVAGTSLYDADTSALQAILAEWASRNNYNLRVANITAGAGLTLGNRLVGDKGANQTVFNDSDIDTLLGKQGQDWFLANRTADDGDVLDKVMDLTKPEIWSDSDL